MPYNQNNQYFIVKGWFESSNGLNNGTFYGAQASADNLMGVERCVLYGEDAKRASTQAASQTGKVLQSELVESTGLNKKEREDSEHLLIDDEDDDQIDEMTSSGAMVMGDKGLFDDPYINKSKLGMKDRGGHGRADGIKTPKSPKPGSNFVKSKKANYLKGIGSGSKGSIPTMSQSGGRKGGVQESFVGGDLGRETFGHGPEAQQASQVQPQPEQPQGNIDHANDFFQDEPEETQTGSGPDVHIMVIYVPVPVQAAVAQPEPQQLPVPTQPSPADDGLSVFDHMSEPDMRI